MSKYRILDVPDMQPGKCANCGASKNDGRKYIDFGLQVDWYGVVHLCGECVKDIARTMGLFTELENKLKLILAEDERLDALQIQGVELHETAVTLFKEFEAYYDRVYATRDDTPPDSTSSVVVESPTTESGTNQAEPRSTKSTSSRRSQNTRSLADLLNDPSE
jgi:nicotinamidase-related amidase